MSRFPLSFLFLGERPYKAGCLFSFFFFSFPARTPPSFSPGRTSGGRSPDFSLVTLVSTESMLKICDFFRTVISTCFKTGTAAIGPLFNKMLSPPQVFLAKPLWAERLATHPPGLRTTHTSPIKEAFLPLNPYLVDISLPIFPRRSIMGGLKEQHFFPPQFPSLCAADSTSRSC